jgi:hypothetical protein
MALSEQCDVGVTACWGTSASASAQVLSPLVQCIGDNCRSCCLLQLVPPPPALAAIAARLAVWTACRGGMSPAGPQRSMLHHTCTCATDTSAALNATSTSYQCTVKCVVRQGLGPQLPPVHIACRRAAPPIQTRLNSRDWLLTELAASGGRRAGLQEGVLTCLRWIVFLDPHKAAVGRKWTIQQCLVEGALPGSARRPLDRRRSVYAEEALQQSSSRLSEGSPLCENALL